MLNELNTRTARPDVPVPGDSIGRLLNGAPVRDDSVNAYIRARIALAANIA